jgi:DNA end-binding protein Ku
MSPRPQWKGFLKLSLVSCPIALYPAVSAAERLSFRQVNRRTGHRLRHQLVDSVTGEAVESAEKARGYQLGADEFLLVEDRDLNRARQARPQPGAATIIEPPVTGAKAAALRAVPDEEEVGSDNAAEEEADTELAPPPRPQNTHTIEIERFVPAGQIDARYFEKPYYITPREPIGQEAFAVIRDAMRGKNMAGLARVVISSRERPILLEPMGMGIRGVTLRFAHEVRKADDYFGSIPELVLPAEMLKLAEHIIETKSAEFEPSMLEDHYRAALVEVLRKKQAQLPARQVGPVEPSGENVVSLMEALRRSLATAESPVATPTLRRAQGLPKPTPARRTGARSRKTG